jgi:hypothetical protein
MYILRGEGVKEAKVTLAEDVAGMATVWVSLKTNVEAWVS